MSGFSCSNTASSGFAHERGVWLVAQAKSEHIAVVQLRPGSIAHIDEHAPGPMSTVLNPESILFEWNVCRPGADPW